MSGQVLSEFLKMNPMLFITPLTNTLQNNPVTVEMTATPLPEFIHCLGPIVRSVERKGIIFHYLSNIKAIPEKENLVLNKS
jgi:hypothetical protein